MLAAGKCFCCKETGHHARDCPLGRTVASTQTNRPPGVSSYNIEIDLDKIYQLHDLAEATETIDDLHLSTVLVGVAEPAGCGSSRGHWQLPCHQIQMGNLIANQAMILLKAMQPYPGDGQDTLEETECRFLVYQIEGGQHVIMDQEVCEDELIDT